MPLVPNPVYALVQLIETGALVPVQVYGGCGHPDPSPGHPRATCNEDEHFSWGLMDRFSTHAPGGSDCNRAASFILRPSDNLMDDNAVRRALRRVLDDRDPALATKP